LKYLLDVNALVALLIFDHEHHDRAETWIKGLADRDEVLLCAWTEMGFIRVALAARYSADVTTARKFFSGFDRLASKLGSSTTTVAANTYHLGLKLTPKWAMVICFHWLRVAAQNWLPWIRAS